MLTSKPGRSVAKVVDSTTVIPALTERIDAQGHFRLLSPQLRPDEIDSTQAVLLAASWARDFAPLIITTLALQHGGPISAASLVPCGTAYYASSPYEPTDPTVTDLPHRRPFGAQWLVTLCGVDGPDISLAVAALNKDLTLNNGHIGFPHRQGNSFFALGIPISNGENLTLSPEAAVQFVVGLLGTRVATVPELILRATPEAPQYARWHFQVASVVTLQRPDGSRVRTSDIWVALEPRSKQPVLSIPRNSQPTMLSPLIPQWPRANDPSSTRLIRLMILRRVGTPLLFDPVTPIRN